MTAALAEQVQRLSTEEKIELLDFVQKELAHENGESEIPQWQADELERREREVAEGRAKWMTIDECRKRGRHARSDGKDFPRRVG